MTSVALGRGRRSLLGKIGSAVATRLRGRRPEAARRVAAAMQLAREHVATLATLTLVDMGAWHGGTVWGFVVTGVSVAVLDFAVRG